MKSTFITLDQKSGAFTLLTILWDNHRPMTRGELVEEAKKESLGRTALYTAIDALKDAGLIKEGLERWMNKRVVTTHLTEKGLTVAEKLYEIREIIDAKNP